MEILRINKIVFFLCLVSIKLYSQEANSFYLTKDTIKISDPIIISVKGKAGKIITSFQEYNKTTNIEKLLNKLNEYRCNLIEDYLSKYEEKWGVIFNKIKNLDFKRLDYQDYEDLCIFCGFTLCRTKYMRKKQLKIIKDLCTENGILKFKDHEIEDLILLLLTFIFPAQLSNVFINEKIIFTVIHNETDLNLITNDNPVRNIRHHNDSIEFIIPISTKFLLKGETIKNPEMISYLNDQFENDVNIMQDWARSNQNIDTSLSRFPKSTGKSIYDLLLFEAKWDDPEKINDINNYMNKQKNLYVIGSEKEDLEPFKQA